MFTSYDLLVDFCLMSFLLFLAKILRSKVRWFQNHYIPSSLIAGAIGLIFGPQLLKITPWSSEAGNYPYLMTCILFAGIFLGKKENINIKYIFNKVGDTFFVNTASEILCFGFALLLGGIIIIIFFPNVFPEICLLLPSGFAGGHGYAAAIGGALNELLGRTDAVYIGQTFATLGLLVGLLGGLICINYAASKEATRFVKNASLLPVECRTGLIPPEKRKPLGITTINNMSMDSLTWHICLVLFATGLGYGLQQILLIIFPHLDFPLMCLTMLSGMFLQMFLKKTNYADYVDKNTIDRISGSLTDYLVAFGVATIKLSVVFEFWQPILILCLLGIVWPVIIVFFVGNKLFHNFWFERSIFIFGYLTGVVAVGITLLRSVDPDMKSETLNDFGCAYTLQSIIEVFLIAIIPSVVVSFGTITPGAILTIIGIVLLLICAKLYGIYNMPMNQLRDGEKEKIS